MLKKQNNKRIVWIDWARSLCMYLVILGHCHINIQDSFITQFIYSFHMMFFFFLSGLICKRDLGLSAIKKDIQYLILPYFSYGTILIFFSVTRERSLDWGTIYSQIISLFIGNDPSIGPIWFLPALFICKQIYYLIKISKTYNRVFFYILVLLAVFPTYLISKYNPNFPLFADSALCGLPFFIIGNECFIFMGIIRQMKWYSCFFLSGLLLYVSIFLCEFNGFVDLASCTIGLSIYAYYINAFAAIMSISIFCIMLNSIRLSFITITSYGTIVTLGLHGIPLTIFNYYLPILIGSEVSTYPLYIAIIYSIITYYICYICIIILDKRYYILFGLKGTLDTQNINPTKTTEHSTESLQESDADHHR